MKQTISQDVLIERFRQFAEVDMRQTSPHDALLEEFRHLKLDGTDTAELAHAIRLLGAMVELLHPLEYERPIVHPMMTASAAQPATTMETFTPAPDSPA